MNGAKSNRRFELGPSNTPVSQAVLATSPLAGLLLWFLFEASRRPSQSCSTNPENVYDDQLSEEIVDECSHKIALRDMVIVYLVVALCWAILGVYLTYYIPRRQELVNAYLTQGITLIGDVFYNPIKKPWCGILTSYGTVVYPHPNQKTPIVIQRQVRIFERYTRERAAIVYLPGQPCSGQPKSDLQIDYDVSQLNQERLLYLKWLCWGWVAFSLIAPIYIMLVLSELDTDEDDGLFWQPDYGEQFIITLIVYTVFAVLIIPAVSMLINVIALRRHQKWMHSTHTILQEGDPVMPSSGCCFDDDDCEELEYQPPTPVQSIDDALDARSRKM
jgi:hypothetical protein